MKTTYIRYMMKCKLSLLLAALMLLLPTSCDKDIHENEYPLADGQGALIIGLESQAEVTDLRAGEPGGGHGPHALPLRQRRHRRPLRDLRQSP